MAVSIMLSIVGLGALCALLFNFAVYVLPVFIGLSVGFWAMGAGASEVGGLVVGFLAGIAVFVLGQMIFSSKRSPATRFLVALIFAAPAAYAGYQLILLILDMGSLANLWQQVFACVGALVVGGTTIARLALPPGEQPIA